jgi:hypothetical protein
VRDLAITLGFSLLCAWVVLHGILMVLSPATAIRFVEWYSRARKWSTPNAEWNPGFGLQWRLGGLAVAVVGVIMMDAAISSLLNPTPTPPIGEPLRPVVHVRPDWYALGIGVAMSIGGLYLLAKPEVFLRWAAGRAPGRTFPAVPDQRSLVAARIMGVLVTLGSLIPIFVWLKSML